MALKIEDLYDDNRFDLIVFYLAKNGILFSDDLAAFDFSELMFVPGISDDLIADARSLYLKSISEDYTENIQKAETSNIATQYKPLSDERPQNTTNVIMDDNIQKPSSEISRTDDVWDIPIEDVFGDLPRGDLFIHYCLGKGIKNISQITDFFFDASKVKGIGAASMEMIHQAYLDAKHKLATDILPSLNPIDIASENLALPINTLPKLGAPSAIIDVLQKHGYSTLADISEKGLSQYHYSLIQKALPRIRIPIASYFEEQLNRVGERSRYCLIQKCQGATLQKIADSLRLTRERVRQIISKSCRTLRDSAEMVAFSIIIKDRDWFPMSELQQRFYDPSMVDCCKYVLADSKAFRYLAFSDKFVRSKTCPKDLDSVLRQFVREIIGRGVNFNDTLEIIDAELSRQGLCFLDFEDIMNYMVKNGYHFYGDYALKGGQSYAYVCYDAVLKYFPFDIKLDSEDDNEDIEELRRIIVKWYSGLSLPSSNRTLTARLANFLVLSGRGRYCPVEKVVYNIDLLNEIYEYIQNNPQTSFYYTELFTLYKGRFMAETNITNPHFFHGILRYIYPDDFQYERDLLVKTGKARSDVNERICELVVRSGGAVTKVDIKKSVPGLNDFVISFTVARVPRLIQWEYNAFNHMDNISVSAEDYKMLEGILSTETVYHSGYLSDDILFRRVKDASPFFLEKNRIISSMNLHYVVAYLFEGQYRFRRPHIVTPEFPADELSIANIAKVLLGCKTELSYESYFSLVNSLGWANGTSYSVFCELEKEFVRVSEDKYVARDVFKPHESFIKEVTHQIDKLVYESGYFAFSSIYSFDSFPDGEYKWNGFLLESIINEFSTGFRIIVPQVKDRRYQRGIIIRSESPIKSFEELVISLLNNDGITSLTEIEMMKYLKNKGVITTAIPQELYDCSMLPYKNEVFTLQ